MKCYQHNNMAAMAGCVSCNRPICSLCVRFIQGICLCPSCAAHLENEVPEQPTDANTPDFPAYQAEVPQGNLPQTELVWLDGVPQNLVPVKQETVPEAPRSWYWGEDRAVLPQRDLQNLAVAGMVISLVSLFSVCCNGFGVFISVIGLGLSIYALAEADKSINSSKVRTYGIIGTVVGGFVTLASCGFLAVLIGSIINSTSNSGF